MSLTRAELLANSIRANYNERVYEVFLNRPTIETPDSTNAVFTFERTSTSVMTAPNHSAIYIDGVRLMSSEFSMSTAGVCTFSSAISTGAVIRADFWRLHT